MLESMDAPQVQEAVAKQVAKDVVLQKIFVIASDSSVLYLVLLQWLLLKLSFSMILLQLKEKLLAQLNKASVPSCSVAQSSMGMMTSTQNIP